MLQAGATSRVHQRCAESGFLNYYFSPDSNVLTSAPGVNTDSRKLILLLLMHSCLVYFFEKLYMARNCFVGHSGSCSCLEQNNWLLLCFGFYLNQQTNAEVDFYTLDFAHLCGHHIQLEVEFNLLLKFYSNEIFIWHFGIGKDVGDLISYFELYVQWSRYDANLL